MSPRQTELLDFVRDHITRMGFAPKVAETATALGISPARVSQITNELVALDQLVRAPRRTRGLGLPGAPDLSGVGSDRLRGELARRGLTFDALAIPEPLNYTGRACAATRCQIAVERGKLMCRRHWNALPHALQKNIVASFYAHDLASYGEKVREAIDLADNMGGVAFARVAA